jgi:trehalose 6-phosphate phosphatase
VTHAHATTPDGEAGLEALTADPARALVATDYDGTLSPIVSDPAAAVAVDGAAGALARLAPLVGTMAIITGRPAAEAVALGGFEDVRGLIILGHYGAERLQDGVLRGSPAPDGVAEAREALPRLLATAGAPDGTRLEDKGTALAVHVRQAANPDAALKLLREPLARLAADSGLVLEPGRLVLELRPPGADKGAALRTLAAERGARSVVFCGDDLGDLAAFAAVRDLRAAGVAGCAVASGSEEAPQVAAVADLVVDGPAGVVRLMNGLADVLEARGAG